MRELATASRIRAFMRALGERAKGPGRIYLVGGATAVLVGWRDTTKDVDIKLDPEPAGVFEAIRDLKDELSLNIELAAPDQFIPAVPGWRERSRFIDSASGIEFFHYDPVSQALAKIERGHAQDLLDVEQLVVRGLITSQQIEDAFDAIRDQLLRYPGLDADSFAAKVDEAMRRLEDSTDG